jgi:hypothetical protein
MGCMVLVAQTEMEPAFFRAGAIGGAVDKASRFGVVGPLASESIKDLRSSRATSVSASPVVCGVGCPTGLRYESKGSY